MISQDANGKYRDVFCVSTDQKGHRYLKEVRELAVRQTRVPNHTLSKMRGKPVLLGVQREKNTNPDRWEDTYKLREPSEIVIVDDVAAYQIFDDSLVIAPRDVAPELERKKSLLS